MGLRDFFSDLDDQVHGLWDDFTGSNQVESANVASAEQAQKQMDFQERMSSTGHQREVADLRAAGLNPLLSVNAGASTPGGASGSGAAGSGAMGPVVPELSAITSSAMDSFRLMNEFRSSKAQSDLAKASAKKVGVETEILKQKGPEAEWDSRFYNFMNGLLDRFGRSSAGRGVRSFGNAVVDDAGNAVNSAHDLKVNWVDHHN